MGTKTISITDDAYNIIKLKKNSGESFSEVIIRLSGKKKISSFYGALSKESADKLEKNINDMRIKHRNLHLKRINS